MGKSSGSAQTVTGPPAAPRLSDKGKTGSRGWCPRVWREAAARGGNGWGRTGDGLTARRTQQTPQASQGRPRPTDPEPRAAPLLT